MKRRRLELAVLGAGVVFLAVLAVSFRPNRKPAAGKKNAPLTALSGDDSGQATTLLDGFDFTESVAGKPLLRIQADRTVGYGPAAGLAPHLYAGEHVTLTVYPEEGEPVTVHSDRADYDERTRQSRLEGNVRWADADGSLALTETVVFHPATRALEAPGRVRFTRGSIDLTAPSARYEVRERLVRFAGPVEGSGTGEDSAGLSRLTAREGLYRRDEGVLELTAVDGQSRTGDRFGSDRLVVQMATAGAGRPEWARATGNVRGILSAEGAASGAGAEKVERQYTGDEGMLQFDAAGKARSFALAGSPALLWGPKRRITAPRIELVFEKGRVSGARAEGGVRIESDDSRAGAERASVRLAGDGAERNAALEGAVRVEADGYRAEAARAEELDSGRRWLLTAGAGRSARVESGASRLSADRIEIVREEKRVRGEGHARAVFSPDARRKSRTVTFVGDSKRPVYGKADRILLDDARGAATLSGGASLWQDTSSLFADEIAISDAEKTVTATQTVRAVLTPVLDREKPGDPGGRAASIVSAKRLRYRDADRSARFEGGVTVVRGGWRAQGAESTAWLNKEGEVESVEISGDVRMTDRTVGRSGQAEKALDYPKTGKTVLWGSPARVIDAGGSQVAGAVLTIVDRGRSVEITAPEGGKTETIHRTRKD